VLPISLKLAEIFSDDPNRPDVSVTAGGSGVGISALLQDNTDIAMASRAIKFQERVAIRERGFEFREETIAFDALAVIIHPSNPVEELTVEQVKGIYRGELTNWNQVGGPDRPIVVFNRESSSGTYGFFQKKVLGGDKFATMQTVGANGELVEKVAANENTIGYVGVAYIDPRVKEVKLFNEKLGRAVAPTIENAMAGIYPLNRPLFFYYLTHHTEQVKPVFDFLLSPAGQEMVRSVGYPPNPAYLEQQPALPDTNTSAARDAEPTDSSAQPNPAR